MLKSPIFLSARERVPARRQTIDASGTYIPVGGGEGGTSAKLLLSLMFFFCSLDSLLTPNEIDERRQCYDGAWVNANEDKEVW